MEKQLLVRSSFHCAFKNEIARDSKQKQTRSNQSKLICSCLNNLRFQMQKSFSMKKHGKSWQISGELIETSRQSSYTHRCHIDWHIYIKTYKHCRGLMFVQCSGKFFSSVSILHRNMVSGLNLLVCFSKKNLNNFT